MKFSLEMGNYSSIYKLAMVAFSALVIQSCGKKEPLVVDNGQIIIKPYSLYVVDTFGQIINTNDGNTYRTSFDPSGLPGRAIATSGENIIWAQSTGLWSMDQQDKPSLQFNPIKISISPIAFNQSMILDVPDQHRIYMAGNQGKGVIYSDSNGKEGTWKVDNAFSPTLPGNVLMTSFALLDDGAVAGYDYVNNRTFIKPGIDDFWQEKKNTNLPAGGKFFISHLRNTLVAADSSGAKGIFYSEDKGDTWKAYTGLPTGAKVLCMQPIFGQSLLVGTVKDGLFRLPLNSTVLEKANQGIDQGATIRGIASKSNLYKNDRIVQLVYLATDKGIYRSQDLGITWFLAKPDNAVLIY